MSVHLTVYRVIPLRHEALHHCVVRKLVVVGVERACGGVSSKAYPMSNHYTTVLPTGNVVLDKTDLPPPRQHLVVVKSCLFCLDFICQVIMHVDLDFKGS